MSFLNNMLKLCFLSLLLFFFRKFKRKCSPASTKFVVCASYLTIVHATSQMPSLHKAESNIFLSFIGQYYKQLLTLRRVFIFKSIADRMKGSIHISYYCSSEFGNGDYSDWDDFDIYQDFINLWLRITATIVTSPFIRLPRKPIGFAVIIWSWPAGKTKQNEFQFIIQHRTEFQTCGLLLSLITGEWLYRMWHLKEMKFYSVHISANHPNPFFDSLNLSPCAVHDDNEAWSSPVRNYVSLN